MGNTPVFTITATGGVLPTFAQCLAFYQDGYLGIYGSDTYLGPDSQDGQWLAIQATALNDTNTMAAAVYNSFSPATAQGTGLSSVVKINGIERDVPTLSSVDLLVIGQAGAQIPAGIVADSNNNRWSMPANIVIPLSGQILVTGNAIVAGATAAPAGSITTIVNPTYGWQSVSNPSAAVPGAPLETDAALRQRQAVSTMLPALGVEDALTGAILAIPGVQVCTTYVNDSNAPDANGIPGHCVSLVVTGGADQDIGNVLFLKKGDGVSTYGMSVVTVTNAYGIPRQVAFFRPVPVPVTFVVNLTPLSGYTADIAASIKSAIATWVNSLGDGKNVLLSRANVPANLYFGTGSAAFEITSIAMARDGAAPTAADVIIAFNERAACDPTYIQILVPPS